MLTAEEVAIPRARKMNVHTIQRRRSGYAAPRTSDIRVLSLRRTLEDCQRAALGARQYELLGGAEQDATLYAVGDLAALQHPCVSIVGTRDVSEAGWLRARRLSKELAVAGVTVVSGLAKGVDTAAHTAAIEAGGRTVAVIGTPVGKAYPAENAKLQEEIYSRHLLISPFAEGENVFRSNFPKRNRVMAALSDATVIIEASDTSGTLHQAAECQRLNRWLFITKSVVDDSSLTWPKRFVGNPRVGVLQSVSDVLDAIRA